MIHIDVISPFAFVPVRYGGLARSVLVDSVEVFDMIGMINWRLWFELVCYFQGWFNSVLLTNASPDGKKKAGWRQFG